MEWKTIIIAIVAGALVLMAVASYASSTTGHFIKDTFNGTPLEQPGEFLVDAGSSLMQTLVTVLMFMLGSGIILVGLYIRFS